MDKQQTANRVRFIGSWTVATVVAVALASVVIAQSPNNPKADIQAGNHFCGADVASLPVIGFVNYHRTGDTVQIEFHLKGARPNEQYFVSLWGDACTFFGNLGVVTTNKNGVANLNGSVDVPAATTRIFATAFNSTTFFNDTPAVTLSPAPLPH